MFPRLLATSSGAFVLLAGVAGCSDRPFLPSESVTPTAWEAEEFIDRDAELVVQWGNGGGDGFFLERADGTLRRAIDELPADVQHPDFSPDGQKIVFRTTAGSKDQIWTAESDGTDATVLFACDASCFGSDFPAWSPDGTSIAFTSYLTPLSSNLPPSGSTIRVIDVASGVIRDVATSGTGDILDNPRWSPDGENLVFQIDSFDAAGTETALAIALVAASGGAVTTITDPALFGGYPDWSPDGDRIVFTTFDLGAYAELPDGAASNLFSVRPDGSDVIQLTHLPPNGERVTQPSWTLDGTGILVTHVSDMGDRTIAIVPAIGGDSIALGDDGGTHPRQRPKP